MFGKSFLKICCFTGEKIVSVSYDLNTLIYEYKPLTSKIMLNMTHLVIMYHTCHNLMIILDSFQATTVVAQEMSFCPSLVLLRECSLFTATGGGGGILRFRCTEILPPLGAGALKICPPSKSAH